MNRHRVGELRGSQLLFSYGVGALIDLPCLSVTVLGLEHWDTRCMQEVAEPRLLSAVRTVIGSQVRALRSPPMPPDTGDGAENPLSPEATIGVPVATFPGWARCPACGTLGRLDGGLFRFIPEPYRPDRARWIHAHCTKPRGEVVALPARFLVACERGHLDDFPWVWFVHRGEDCALGSPRLSLSERGFDAADVTIHCSCGQHRTIAEAFDREPGRSPLRPCAGHHPHLPNAQASDCGVESRAILLGASNSWFAITMAALSLPVTEDPLDQLVEEHWPALQAIETRAELPVARKFSQQLQVSFSDVDDAGLWSAIERRRIRSHQHEDAAEPDLLPAEWQAFTGPGQQPSSNDFLLTSVAVPPALQPRVSSVVLAERLREVRALIGFTRLASPGEFGEIEEIDPLRRAPLSREAPLWVPAAEVRGEGIFLRFDEERVAAWVHGHPDWEQAFRVAHRQWRHQRGIEPEDAGFPGLRYVLLHSFSHALIRQLAQECGYPAASIRERIYAREAEDDGRMAGVLLYTAAPDSEGTLGGLVSLGRPESLAALAAQALESLRVCTSDPLCAEHHPHRQGTTLHGAACHACLFLPESSCERGNRYLDRSLLVPVLGETSRACFPTQSSS